MYTICKNINTEPYALVVKSMSKMEVRNQQGLYASIKYHDCCMALKYSQVIKEHMNNIWQAQKSYSAETPLILFKNKMKADLLPNASTNLGSPGALESGKKWK